jgi:hypothetical protein
MLKGRKRREAYFPWTSYVDASSLGAGWERKTGTTTVETDTTYGANTVTITAAVYKQMKPLQSEDMWCEITIPAIDDVGSGFSAAGPAVRMQENGECYYLRQNSSTNINLERIDSSGGFLWGINFAHAASAGDRLRLEAETAGGTVILRGYLNGKIIIETAEAQVTDVDAVSPLRSKHAGFYYVQGSDTHIGMDNWQAGTFNKPRFALADVPTDVRILKVPSPWTKKPQNVPVDYGHPLLRNIDVLHTFQSWDDDTGKGGWTRVNDSGGRIGLDATTPFGTGLRIDSTALSGTASGFWSEAAGHEYTNFTQSYVGRLKTLAAGGTTNGLVGIAEDYGSATADRSFYIDASDNITFYYWDGSAQHVNLGVTAVPGDVIACTAVLNNDVVKTYAYNLTTKKYATTADLTVGTLYTGYATPVMQFGPQGNMPGGLVASNQDVLLVLVSTRLWTDVEAESFVRNPWQIFKPQNILAALPEDLPKLAKFEKQRTRQP